MEQKKILIIVALESELPLADTPSGIEIIHCGVGKVNATAVTTAAIITRKPDLVINFGTAGKISTDIHGLVEVASVMQRDMMAMPLAARGVTPFSNDASTLSSGVDGVCCGTGDNFVTAADTWFVENGIDVVDMELFAIAHTCNRYDVPWRAFKYISDDANDAAAEDWSSNVRKGNVLFLERLKTIYGHDIKMQ